MKTPLNMQEKVGNAWVLVSRNVWVPLNSVVLDRATPAPSAAHSCVGMYLVMLQQALRAVTRKTETVFPTICWILSERSSLSPGKRVHHQRRKII
jgi:hypothetical protein